MSDDRRMDGLKVLQDPSCDIREESFAPAAANGPDPQIIERIKDFILAIEKSSNRSLIADLKRDGISRDALAEIYVPAVALALGDDWCADTLDFARVTIGASRLQGLLRDVTQGLFAHDGPDPGGPVILVTTLPERTHTLGAMVMAAQLRRRGCSVRLALGRPLGQITAQLAALPFDAIFFSASLSEEPSDIGALIGKIRASNARLPPVVVGGSILEKDCASLRESGLNHLTSSIDEALTLCDLTRHLPPTASS